MLPPPLPLPTRRELLRELASSPGGAEITVGSGSMRPTVEPGDRVRVRGARVTELAPGQVLLFETADGGDLVLHRLVAISPRLGWFLHIGDGGSHEGVAIARTRSIVAVAELPARPPSAAELASGVARLLKMVPRAARRSLRW